MNTPYDTVPYPDLCFAQTHPDRLATIAALLGLNPAAPDNCRVLELGCAGGGNLIPMALAMPNSQFVGVDYAARQIDSGRDTIAQLGLSNIRLEQADIRDLDPDFGQFDYIIAHGLYSWVPADVRQALWHICRQNLAANGIAYISYNVYPGWHLMGAIRQMMLFHTRHEAEPLTKVGKARELVQFLADAIADSDNIQGSFLKTYLNFLQEHTTRSGERSDALLLHDELEAVNDPVYFYQFAAEASEHGLQYLAESDFPLVMPTNFKPEVTKWLLNTAKNGIELEQYMDFIRNRTLRQSLLCHQEINFQRRLQVNPALFARLFVASRARPVTDSAEMSRPGVVRFRAPDGAMLATDHPVSIAALNFLTEISPQAVPFPSLLAMAQAQTGSQQEQDGLILAANLLRGFSYSLHLIELHLFNPPFTTEVTSRPVASPLARYQASQRQKKVVNLRHERVECDSLTGRLLLQLDGQHDQAGLLAFLESLVDDGIIALKAETEGGASRPEQLAHELNLVLTWLAHAALLVG